MGWSTVGYRQRGIKYLGSHYLSLEVLCFFPFWVDHRHSLAEAAIKQLGH